MAASFPSSQKSFGSRSDYTDTVLASDVNDSYREIEAIEAVLGTSTNSPISSSTWGATSTLNTSTVSWGSVGARLQNIENGLYTAYSDRVKQSGGSTISTSGSSAGLTISTGTSGSLLVVGATTFNSAGYLVSLDGGTA
jgi:hypothetical protein